MQKPISEIFSPAVLSDINRLHLTWFAYMKDRGLDGYIEDITPHLEKGDEWAVGLLTFSRTWFTGDQKRKTQWHELMLLSEKGLAKDGVKKTPHRTSKKRKKP